MSELLAVVYRGGQMESRHTGSIAVVNAKGEILYKLGDPEQVVFARSSLKPIQAIPLMMSGGADRFGFDDAEIAICCGSHDGEEKHIETVRRMLDKLGVSEECLECGARRPYSEESYIKLLRGGGKPEPIHNVCSGKHAGMLALALHLDSDIRDYYRDSHPVQLKIKEIVLRLSGLGERELVTAKDGCGIPTYAMPLHRLALLFARFSDPAGGGSRQIADAAGRIIRAISRHPLMVGGTDEFDTDLVGLTGGKVVAKVGAEGEYCMALPDKGVGIAMTIDDGNSRAAYPAAVEILDQLGVLSPKEKELLRDYHRPVLRNHRNEEIGSIEPVFELKRTGSLSMGRSAV